MTEKIVPPILYIPTANENPDGDDPGGENVTLEYRRLVDGLIVPEGFFSDLADEVGFEADQLTQLIDQMPTVSNAGPGTVGVGGLYFVDQRR